MSEQLVIAYDLKKRIESIISEEAERMIEPMSQEWVIKKRTMFRCGKEVLKDYPGLMGEGGQSTYRKVGRKIERHHQTIKRWVELVKKVKRDYNGNFDRYADTELQKMLARWWEKQLPEPKKETPPLPEGRYPVIYADPPWKYDIDIDRKAIEKHYQTMDYGELIEFGEKVKEIRAPQCVLYMWTTSAKLNWAIPVMTAWGFQYKSSMVWDKVDYNMGYYSSIRHEFLLIGTRGSFAPQDHKAANGIDSVISIPKGEHSEKPERFREIIDELYPEGPALEMFSRKNANELPERWDTWGLESHE